MLTEIVAVRQTEGEPRKRWWNDADFDLFTWHRDDGSLCRFELSYDKQTGEHALRWDARDGLNAYSVDDGDITGRHKMSAVLREESSDVAQRVGEAFRKAAVNVEPAIVAIVCARLGLPPVRDRLGD